MLYKLLSWKVSLNTQDSTERHFRFSKLVLTAVCYQQHVLTATLTQ